MLKLDKIYNMDCLDGMKQLDDNSIDLIITDPPYGATKDKEDYLAIEFIKDCFRILKDNCGCYCFVGQETLPYFFLEFKKSGFTWQNTIIWYYKNTFSKETKRFVLQYDPILYFTKGDCSINKDNVRVPYISKERLKYPCRNKNDRCWRPNPLGAKRGDVWEIPAISGKVFEKENLHKWQKPKKLIDIIIKASSNENDLILDCFVGSGTIPYCCRKLNRQYLGFEINKEYYNIALKRLLNIPERLESFIT